jgi:hypothetical protein
MTVKRFTGPLDTSLGCVWMRHGLYVALHPLLVSYCSVERTLCRASVLATLDACALLVRTSLKSD